jgi:transcriptional regulator of acetoin/glycerol metabolism
MAKSTVGSYEAGGHAVTSGRIMVGRTATKKKWQAIHRVRGMDIPSTLGTGTGTKKEATGQTLKGSFSRQETAKALKSLHAHPERASGSMTPAARIIKAHNSTMVGKGKGVHHRPAGSPRGGQFF